METTLFEVRRTITDEFIGRYLVSEGWQAAEMAARDLGFASVDEANRAARGINQFAVIDVSPGGANWAHEYRRDG